MLYFLYENYPYGNGEAFVEYEMRDFAANQKEDLTIYVLRKSDSCTKKFVPENAKIVFIENKSFRILFSSFLKLFHKSSLKEILSVLKNHYPEGIFRCLYRIYRYITVAESFIDQYKKNCDNNTSNTFVSYWLNECAFALTQLKRKYPNIKIASRGHGFDVFEERCYLPFRKEILSGLDRIFLINIESKLYFEKIYGSWLDTSKIEISHLGVNLPEKIPQKDKADIFRIVTCSSVITLKRLDLLIDALSGIKNKKIEWVHFGGGPLLDDIKKYAKEKMAQSSVKYSFKGQVSLEEIQIFYASTPIHLFVNCSDTEGTPVSIMEAMSYGIPTIARNVGGINELVDNTCGRLLPKEENPELIKKAIEEFFQLTLQEYMKICENARLKIECEFNAAKTYTEYIKKILSL